MRHVVYGLPPADLAEIPAQAAQVSPSIPGSTRLEDLNPGSLEAAILLAPAGTIERRYALALALRALEPGAALTALAPKDRGGARLAKELRGFGAEVAEDARRHHRICRIVRPETIEGLDDALLEGGPRHIDNIALNTQPGIFAWDRVDPGSELLLRHLPKLAGRGADFGCGLGVLALAVLESERVTALTLIDNDRRAVEMSRANIADDRADIRWADLRHPDPDLSGLDFVVMNPPFHDGGAEDQALGAMFIKRAAQALRPGGALWLTANKHLPYEAVLHAEFGSVTLQALEDGYKVFEARR